MLDSDSMCVCTSECYPSVDAVDCVSRQRRRQTVFPASSLQALYLRLPRYLSIMTGNLSEKYYTFHVVDSDGFGIADLTPLSPPAQRLLEFESDYSLLTRPVLKCLLKPVIILDRMTTLRIDRA